MTRSINKPRKKQVKSEVSEVRRFLNDWDPIAGSPAEEYDCLVDKIVSALHQGVSETDLIELIQGELRGHFGISEPANNVANVSHRIISWWGDRPAPESGE
jgi:hypothetical protein